MTRSLKMHRRPARSGRAGSLVVFVHGYGADGGDLIGLAEPLGPHMPDTAFAAPDAPDRCALNPAGYQWAPIPGFDGSDAKAAERAFLASVDDLNAAVDGLLQELGLGPDRLILFGFSQGCMLCLHAAPRRPVPVAGVVGVSGRLLEPDRLPGQIVSRPPMLLIHGDRDEVVPYASLADAERVLRENGVDVAVHTMRGSGHGIAPDGLSIALAFMRDRLGLA